MEDSDKPNNEALVLKQLKSMKVTLWVIALTIVLIIIPVLAGVCVGTALGYNALKNENTALREELKRLVDENEEKVQLPRHGGTSLVSKERPFYINVLRDGTYRVQGETVDLDTLQVKLNNRHREKPEQRVTIRGDAKALHGHATAALAAVSQAGFPSANIAWDTSPIE